MASRTKMSVPEPRKLPSGNWTIQIMIGGSRKSITCRTKDECIKQARMEKAIYQAKHERTVQCRDSLESAIRDYIRSKDNVLSPSTIRGYEAICSQRFKEYMNKPIGKISYQQMVNDEVPLASAKTIKNAFALVASAVSAKGINVGEVRLPQIVKKERPFLNRDEVKIFIEAVKGSSVEIPALMALHGLRRSELIKVEKSDVKDGKIFIQGSIVRDKDNNYVEKKTNKNTGSRRVVPIFIPRLAELIEQCDEGKLVKQKPDSVYQTINRICKRNNLPVVGLHGLRHSFASLCYFSGVKEELAMKIGGWMDPSTMRKIYTHISEKEMDEAEASLNAAMSNILN